MTEMTTDRWGREIPASMVAKRVNFTELPVVDFGPFLTGDIQDRKTVAAALRKACVEVGFFYLKNHGVSQELVDATFAKGAEFIDLPVEQKMEVAKSKTPGYGGYSPLGELGSATGMGNNQEGFNMNLELPLDDEYVTSGRTFYNPNSWPAAPEGFREQMLAYFDAMLELSRNLLRAFALALDLEENYFDSSVTKPIALLRYIHYPEQEVNPEFELGLVPHTDFEAFTILAQKADLEALEVVNGNGEWVSAPPVEGTFVINIGDQMAHWTNDLFSSTFHRVINKSGKPRSSMPFFFGTNYDTVMNPLPTCVSENNPARYEPITAGEYIANRIRDAYGYALTEKSATAG